MLTVIPWGASSTAIAFENPHKALLAVMYAAIFGGGVPKTAELRMFTIRP